MSENIQEKMKEYRLIYGFEQIRQSGLKGLIRL